MSPVIIPPGVQFLSLTRTCLFTGYPSGYGLRNRSLGGVPPNSDYILFHSGGINTKLSYGGLLTYLCYHRAFIMSTAIVKITLDLIPPSWVNRHTQDDKAVDHFRFPGIACSGMKFEIIISMHQKGSSARTCLQCFSSNYFALVTCRWIKWQVLLNSLRTDG